MTWRVFVRSAAEADLERLDAPDQQAVSEELFAWVEQDPPRQTPRDVLGVLMFDDVRGRFRITYVIDDEQEHILLVRILKVPAGP